MKKIMIITLCVVLCLAGCSENSVTTEQSVETDKAQFPEQLCGNYYFSSGAGGWSTVLAVNSDGTFQGSYSDSELGEMGEGYAGTVYVCDFTGRFDGGEWSGDNSFSTHISDVETAEKEGTEWIEEGVRYVAAGPFGMEKGEDYTFYTPEMPTEGLDDEFLTWWQHYFEEDPPETLGQYAIRNNEMNYGFFKY